MRVRYWFYISLAAASVAGCASQAMRIGPDVDIPAPTIQVFSCIRREIASGAIPGGIAHQSEFELTTGWTEQTGDTRGIWFWKKTFRERQRYRFRIYARRFDAATRVEIGVDLEERPNASYPWEDAPPNRRDDAENAAVRVLHVLANKCQ